MHRILAAATVLLSLHSPVTAISKPPPPPINPLQSCELHTTAMLDLLKSIAVVEGQLFGTAAWRRRLSQMQKGLEDLPSPVVTRFLARKLQPLSEEPNNQEHLTIFTAKRQTLYERMLVHSNPVEMTNALLDDAIRIENLMGTLPAEEHAKLRFGSQRSSSSLMPRASACGRFISSCLVVWADPIRGDLLTYAPSLFGLMRS